MSYDFDMAPDREPPKLAAAPVYRANDLEAIVLLLDLAAIFLTPKAGTLFTEDQLLTQAQEIAGENLVLDKRDVRIVLPFVKTLKRHSGKRYSLR